MPSSRLLFASPHCLLDPTNGASLATRDLQELLAARGWACAALCGARTDAPVAIETNNPQLVHGVTLAVYDGLREKSASRSEGVAFLEHFERVLAEFRPNTLLTYGGDWVVWELIARARAQGVRVVFALHNLAYTDGKPFQAVDALLVPSEYVREHYWRTLGLEATAIPGAWKEKVSGTFNKGS